MLCLLATKLSVQLVGIFARQFCCHQPGPWWITWHEHSGSLLTSDMSSLATTADWSYFQLMEFIPASFRMLDCAPSAPTWLDHVRQVTCDITSLTNNLVLISIPLSRVIPLHDIDDLSSVTTLLPLCTSTLSYSFKRSHSTPVIRSFSTMYPILGWWVGSNDTTELAQLSHT